MHRTIRRIPVVLAIAAGFVPAVAHGQAAPSAQQWSPDKDLLENLAPAKALGGYTIRPPKGYQMQQAPANAPAGVKMHAWAGEPRKDGTKPSVLVMFLTPPSGEAPKMTLEQLAERMLGGVKRRRTNWKQGEPEIGMVNGIKFVRVRWTGNEPALNADMEGFVYVAQDGNTILQLTSQDTVAEAKKTLPIAEASVLTLKKN